MGFYMVFIQLLDRSFSKANILFYFSCFIGSSCDPPESVMDSHTTGPGFKTWLVQYFLPSFRMSTTKTTSSS